MFSDLKNKVSLLMQGVYYQTGDVIKVTDEEDGKAYYAQIRGFVQDQYCEKSAALTWLIPTQASPKDQFDPGTYIIGPEEDLPRKMEYLEFVCHAPSEYFKSRTSPFPTIPIRPEKGYIWTHIGPTPAFTVKEPISGSCWKDLAWIVSVLKTFLYICKHLKDIFILIEMRPRFGLKCKS